MKGVNKLVLEVRPDDDYFEKAILFLNPDKLNEPQKTVSDNAERLLSDIKNNRNDKVSASIIHIIIGAAAGSAFSWLLFFLTGMTG